MFSDKLISLLLTFSKYDLNRFRKFLQSPYFNDQDDVLRLFEQINLAIRKGDDSLTKLDRSTVWKHLYPKQKPDDTHLRRLASDLTLLAQRFMVEEARGQDPLSEALDLQKVLDKPELNKHLAGVERQVEKLLVQNVGKSADHYFAQFRLHWNVFNRASKMGNTSGYAEKLGSADFALECFYLIQKLKFFVSWLLYSGFRTTERKIPVMPGFWDYLQDERFASVALVRVLNKVITCFAEPDEEQHFRDLLADLDRQAMELTKDDLRESFYMAQNYCALKINQGKTAYYREVFNIFKSMIDKDLLSENGQLSEQVFKNVITSSLGVGEYTWTEQFIQQYVEYLPQHIRGNARLFNLAYVYFYQKNYGKVIELLSNVEYSDVVYSLGAKSILLRTYYEREEYLALDSLIDSFRIFLRRNKVLSKNLKREYNNYLNLVRKLSTLKMSDDKVTPQLRKRVMETSFSMPKKWLLEKINELG